MYVEHLADPNGVHCVAQRFGHRFLVLSAFISSPKNEPSVQLVRQKIFLS
jgi:hypothetical protein